MQRDYAPNWHHRIIANALERVERGELKRLMIFVPPRHGKSQLATINYPSWYLGRNPDKEVITASYSGELAQDFGSKTRALVDDPYYQMIFDTRLKADEKSRAKWLTNKKGSYTSVGVGGAITGRGADLLIIDDPLKNREEADSQTIRDKVWDWYTSTAYTRLEKGAAIIVILTRWHMDDLAGRLLEAEKDGGDKWEVIKFPAIAIKNEEHRKIGEALWEEKYDVSELNKIKKVVGTMDWSALYQQEPILSETQEFKPHFFVKRAESEVDALQTRNFLTIDTAISQKTSADYTGLCLNYVDRENNWNLKTLKLRLNPRDLIDLMFRLHEENGFEKIGIEKTIYLDVFKYLLEDECKKRNKFLPTVELEHKQTAKETRIRGLIPRYEAHAIYHIDCKDLEEEALSFPKGTHDDVIDATAYQLQIAEPPMGEDYEIHIQQNRENYRREQDI